MSTAQNRMVYIAPSRSRHCAEERRREVYCNIIYPAHPKIRLILVLNKGVAPITIGARAV